MASPVAVFGAAEADKPHYSGSNEGSRASEPARGARRSQVNAAETVASKFRAQLKELMRQIAAHEASVCRCIRPNDEALAMGQQGSFDRIAVVEQLRCCGVLLLYEWLELVIPTENRCGPLWSDLRSVCPEMVEVQH